MKVIEKPIKISEDSLAMLVNSIRNIVADTLRQEMYNDSYKDYIREICRIVCQEEIEKNNTSDTGN